MPASENRAIHEFATGTPDNGSLFLVDTPDQSAESGYTTEKLPMTDVGSKLVNGIQYTQNLNTDVKTISGAINEVVTYLMNVAEQYDSTATYAVGDYVWYNHNLYKCIIAVTVPESFDSSKWTAVILTEEIGQGGGASWVDITGTLAAGSTSLTISDVSILTTSTIDVYTDTFGVNPTNVVVATGSVTLTFEAQNNNIGVKVRVS